MEAQTLELLGRAEGLLRARDVDGALAALGEAWASAPAVELAEAYERVIERVTPAAPPVHAGGTSLRRAWLALAAEQRPSTLGRLLEELPEGTCERACERLAALAAWPRSPLLASACVGWLRAMPFRAANRAPFALAVLALLERQRDPRALPALRAVVDEGSTAVQRIGRVAHREAKDLARRAAGWPPAPEAPAAVHAALASLLALAPAPRGARDLAACWAAVYADLASDEPRHVLADALLEAGDPRGEFLQLQLARAGTDQPPSPRERELFDAWHRVWLGALEPMLLKGGVTFERGLLHGARVTRLLDPALCEELGWASVERLDVSRVAYQGRAAHPLLLGRACRSLRHVEGAGAQDLEALAGAEGELPWETLTLRVGAWGDAHAAQLGRAARRLPALERFGIRHLFGFEEIEGLDARALKRLLGLPWARRPRVVELLLYPWGFGPCAAVARKAGLERLDVALAAVRPTPTGSLDGGLLGFQPRERALEIRVADEQQLEPALAALQVLEPSLVSRVRLEARRFHGGPLAEDLRSLAHASRWALELPAARGGRR